MSLVYVYAIARAASPAPAGLRGLDDAAVRAVREGELAAFVSDVPEAEFGEGPLNKNLADMDWVTPRAVRHQEVNASLADRCDPLVPLAFGAVFRDAAGVTRMLRDRAADIGPRFEMLKGRAEWIGVVRRDREAAAAAVESGSETLRALRAEVAAAPPGRGYLVAKRLDETQRQELRATDANAIVAAVESFERAGLRLFREPLVEDAGGGMLARYSLLAPRGAGRAMEDLRTTFDRAWRPRGYTMELSGPWPAYRFSTVDPR